MPSTSPWGLPGSWFFWWVNNQNTSIDLEIKKTNRFALGHPGLPFESLERVNGPCHRPGKSHFKDASFWTVRQHLCASLGVFRETGRRPFGPDQRWGPFRRRVRWPRLAQASNETEHHRRSWDVSRL